MNRVYDVVFYTNSGHQLERSVEYRGSELELIESLEGQVSQMLGNGLFSFCHTHGVLKLLPENIIGIEVQVEHWSH